MSVSICFCNHKGGVGKTTSAVNVAYCLSKMKKDVLVIDADTQGNATMILGEKDPFEYEETMRDLFLHEKTISDVAVPSKYNRIDLVPCNIEAVQIAQQLPASSAARVYGLAHAMDTQAKNKYDYVIVDTPPSLESILLLNAVVLCSFYVVPVEVESNFALAGVQTLLHTLQSETKHARAPIQLLGGVMTRYDGRLVAARAVASGVQSFFGELTFKAKITRNAATSRANLRNRAVCETDSAGKAAQAYRDLTKEIVARIAQVEAQSAAA